MKIVTCYYVSGALVRDFALAKLPAATCIVRAQYDDWPGFLYFARGEHNINSAYDYADWRLISRIEFDRISEEAT